MNMTLLRYLLPDARPAHEKTGAESSRV